MISRFARRFHQGLTHTLCNSQFKRNRGRACRGQAPPQAEAARGQGAGRDGHRDAGDRGAGAGGGAVQGLSGFPGAGFGGQPAGGAVAARALASARRLAGGGAVTDGDIGTFRSRAAALRSGAIPSGSDHRRAPDRAAVRPGGRHLQTPGGPPADRRRRAVRGRGRWSIGGRAGNRSLDHGG